MSKKQVTEAGQPRLSEDSDSGFSAEELQVIESLIAAHVDRVASLDLYTIRYRRGTAGVQTGFVRASSLSQAEEIGRTYCSSLVGCQYITVTKAVLADESILTDHDIRRQLATA